MVILITLLLVNLATVALTNFRYIYLQGYIFLTLFILIVGFRPITYGDDSLTYYQNYFLIFRNTSFPALSERDFIFKLISALVAQFSSSWVSFALVWSTLTGFLVWKISAKEEQQNMGLILTTLCTSPILLENSTNILRSTITSLWIFSVLLHSKTRIKSFIGAIVALNIHVLQTIILLPPVMVGLIKRSVSRRTNSWIIGLSAMIACLKLLGFSLASQSLTGSFVVIDFLNDLSLNYVESQIIGTQDFSISLFVQFTMYILIPNLSAMVGCKSERLPWLFPIASLTGLLYIILYPEFILALRFIPALHVISIFLMCKYSNAMTKMIVFALASVGGFIYLKNFVWQGFY